MIWLCLALIPLSFALATPLTALAVKVGTRATPQSTTPDQGTRFSSKSVPTTGGIPITIAILLPLLLALLGVWTLADTLASALPVIEPHLGGIKSQTPLALKLIGALLALHILGLIDDRRAVSPLFKLIVMFGVAGIIATWSDSRLLEMVNALVGGTWLSIMITILWLVAVTNALNFMDNMDGLAGGVAAVAGACFLAAALIQGQWFIAASLALLVGACSGFLIFNFAPAKIYMGDSGSLVIGFLLAFLTVRTTYVPAPLPHADETPALFASGDGWYAVFMPLIVLAIPLYDLVSVTLLRLSQGKSPWIGDTQHLSHRLVARGLSVRLTAGIIYALTAVTGISGIVLALGGPGQAILIAIQTGVILTIIAVFEFTTSSGATSVSEDAS